MNTTPQLLVTLIALLAIACSNGGSQNQSDIERRIAEDLKAPATAVHLVTPDNLDLPQKKFVTDKDHSSISFRTEHWEIVDLIGWFEEFEIVMYADEPDFSDAVILAVVNPESLQMPNEKMEQSASHQPYIDSEKFPEVTFQSSAFIKTGEDTYLLEGDFTMNNVTVSLPFEVTFNGFAYPGEQSTCGFNVEGKINRHDFNIAGHDQLHSGKAMHGDTIYLFMSLRME